jgi:hypothetical protein
MQGSAFHSSHFTVYIDFSGYIFQAVQVAKWQMKPVKVLKNVNGKMYTGVSAW